VKADFMAQLIIWNIMSLDGAFEGAAPWDLSMHQTVWGPELEQFSKQQLADDAQLLFGRATYEGMASYWQSEAETGEIADGMNNAPKAVVSTTLVSADWKNTLLLRSIGDVATLKKDGAHKNIFVFGSATLVSGLRQAGLIDEYRICIAPILLGAGAPMFKVGDGRQNLKLLQARPIAGGGVILFYQPQA
jgi:dihydrofolate reductase